MNHFTQTLWKLAIMVFLVSCTGSDDNITQESIDGDTTFGGFVGVESVQTISATKVTVSWSASGDSKVKGYNIYDSTIRNAPRILRSVDKNITQFTVTGLREGVLYNFRVRAFDEDDKEDTNENDMFGIPFEGIGGATVESSTSARIFIKPAHEGEALQGNVYCKTPDTEWEVYASVSDMSANSVLIQDLTQNTNYTCKYNLKIGSLEDNNLQRVTFAALGRAERLAFSEDFGGTQPGNGQSGELLSVQPKVVVLDENDNIVSGGPDSEALITLTVAVDSPTTGLVRGTASMNAVNGVADFTDLFMQEAGVKILTATKEDTSSLSFGTPSMNVNSNSFTINPGNVSPTLSSIEIDPPTTTLVANGSDSYQVKFILKDEFGNSVEGIRPEFASNVVNDLRSQPVNPTDENGETTGVIATTVADTNQSTLTRVLRVTSPAGLEGLTVNAPFQPGPAKKLAFTGQPQNSPAGENGMNDIRVSVQDNFNNTIVNGASSAVPVSLSINNNISGATLTGTNPVTSDQGHAEFSDLGIDMTGNGYRLVANSGSLDPAYSNNFNITSGIPRVIAMEGPNDVISGGCSEVIVLQLRDFGGNPAKAVQSTTIQLSGVGNAQLYTNTSCSGSPISNSITFIPGSDTRNLYLRNQKVENLNIAANDASSVLVPADYNIQTTPSKIELVAQAAPPAAPGNPLQVLSDRCSTPMYIVPLSEDGSEGQFFSSTQLALTGFTGAETKVYSDEACVNEVDVTDISTTVGAPPNQNTVLYVKGPVNESLLVNVTDPTGKMTTVSMPQTVEILASEINFTGPNSVASLNCSEAFTVILEDSQGNATVTNTDLTFAINGLESYPTGSFYSSSGCNGAGSNESIIIPAGTSSTSIYFRGVDSGVLNLSLSDEIGNTNDSNSLELFITPSNLNLEAPTAATSSGTSDCFGPFALETQDGNGVVSSVVEDTVVDFSGLGDSAFFYLDETCETSVPSVTFTNGESSKDIWFTGYYPESNMTLVASDPEGVLISATLNWAVTPAIGFLGTTADITYPYFAMSPFRKNFKSVKAIEDGVQGAMYLAFDPNKKFLYVTDYRDNKIVKYDYINNRYIGWVGSLNKANGAGPVGSNIPNPSSALCINTGQYQVVPGWCVGGRSWDTNNANGGLRSPWGIVVDDTYVYVANENGHTVNRYLAETGTFDGWIGVANIMSSAIDAIDDGTTSNDQCPNTPPFSPTPTWCMGGQERMGGFGGNGQMRRPRGIETDSTYLYVTNEAAVLRYNKTSGAFAGWIGRIVEAPTANAPGTVGDCVSTARGDLTPGWCFGGSYEIGHTINTGFFHYPSEAKIVGNILYVVNSGYGSSVGRYDVNTGAYLGPMPNQQYDWNARQLAWNPDASRFLVANYKSIMRVDSTGLVDGWLGKVQNNSGMSGPNGCSTLETNDNTPGWCIGGTNRPGLDEGAFLGNQGIAYDGNGHFVTASIDVAKIQKFNADTGEYIGAWGREDTSPNFWSDDKSSRTEGAGTSDAAAYTPTGVVAVGDFLFVTDKNGSRVKKISKKTGEVVGWIGGMTTKPTGGETPGCPDANAMGPSPGWCLGSEMYPNYIFGRDDMIDDLIPGIMHSPFGLATDGTWLYITDYALHRVHKYLVEDGSYGGWLGRVGTASPIGGSGNNCLGAQRGTFTEGWCLGGLSEYGGADGNLYQPTGITYANGNIYVVDSINERVSSYNAITGQFNGWIGRVNSTPTGGCSPASNGDYLVSNTGWCLGGSAAMANYWYDRGGGFNFGKTGDVHSDGVHLYITNTLNSRVDKYNFNGEFVEATGTYRNTYSNVWENDPAVVGNIGGSKCDFPISVWVDGDYIYGLNNQTCSRSYNPAVIWKMNKNTGSMYGWKGGIGNVSPTGGESGCLGASGFTPAWCQGGQSTNYYKLGGFSGADGMLTGDEEFLYVTDQAGNRVMRVPK